MPARGFKFLTLLPLAVCLTCGLMASAQEQVDYRSFAALAADLAPERDARLIPLDTFNQFKTAPETITLDTRSESAFAMGHIEGAVHLSFSDFTAEKLAAIIPSKDTRILIYCNNNFTDNVAPVMLKRAELALNIPTFINLWGYGYENLYELDGAYSIQQPDVNWQAAALTGADSPDPL